MKNYPSPPFTEAYIIQLPQIVKDDKDLNWTDRIAYWFFVHHKGDSAAVIAEMGLSTRRFREIKNRLAARGHIARIEEKNQIKYIAVDCDSAYLIRIDKFRNASKTGFQKIGDQNIFALKLYHTYAHILHVMEVLEWTYRTGNVTIKNPHHLLTRSCKTGVTPAADFVPGFWEQTALAEFQEAKREEAKATGELKQLKEKRLMQEYIDAQYNSLSERDKKTLMEKATAEIIRLEGKLPKFAPHRVIEYKAKEILFREGTA